VAIFSQVDACPVIPLPFKDHLSTQAHQIGPKTSPKADQGIIGNDTYMEC